MPVPEDPETGAAVPSAPAQEPALEEITDSDENEQNQRVEEETGEAFNRRLEPTSHFTGHQLFYIFGLDGIGALALSGGVNFAIAYGKLCPSSLSTCIQDPHR
jgi:hypothetical protein